MTRLAIIAAITVDVTLSIIILVNVAPIVYAFGVGLITAVTNR